MERKYTGENSLISEGASPKIHRKLCDTCMGAGTIYNWETNENELCRECDGTGYLEIQT